MLKSKTTKAMMAEVRERALKPKMGRHMRGSQEQGLAFFVELVDWGYSCILKSLPLALVRPIFLVQSSNWAPTPIYLSSKEWTKTVFAGRECHDLVLWYFLRHIMHIIGHP